MLQLPQTPEMRRYWRAFGSAMVAFRKRAMLSQEQIARKMGRQRQQISSWERGKVNQSMSPWEMRLFARLCNRRVEELFILAEDYDRDFEHDEREAS